jgi:ATP synthase protein I
MVEPQQRKSMKRRQRLGETISQQAERKLRAREENRRTAWFGLGTFGLVGWSVAIPTLLGTALGVWLDGRWPGQVSWTLTFLIIGVALGCLNAWYWINEESNRD